MREDCPDRVPDNERRGAEPFDLFATALITQRTTAEVLAVVGQEPIAAFAQARTRAFHHLAAIERRRFASNPEAAAGIENAELGVVAGVLAVSQARSTRGRLRSD